MTPNFMNYYFQCVDCGKEYDGNDLEYVCPSCSVLQKKMEPTRGVLKVLFDYKKLKKPAFALKDMSLLPPLKVGPTPLYKDTRLAEGLGFNNL